MILTILVALIILIALIIFAAIAAYSQLRRRGNDEASVARQLQQSQSQHEAVLAANEQSHRREMDLLRQNFSEQKREMQDAYAAQIAEMRQQMKERYDAMERRHAEQSRALSEQSAQTFEALSKRILEAESDRLVRRSDERLSEIVTPLRERIEEFKKLVRDSYDKENMARAGLMGQIEQLMSLNKSISDEAHNLTTALKGDSKTQGDWGEMILQTLLEQGGLTEGIHFEVQLTRNESGEVIRDEAGRLQRPDVVINLPDSKRLVVDSKVSLTAFANYCNAETEQQRAEYGRAHLQSVKRHIAELGDKQYQANIKDACGHVLMFIPTENAYLLALKLDANLWSEAYRRNVAIVSPTHLFSVVHLISQLWTQDAQNKNVQKIAEKGAALYDKLTTFCENYLKIGSSIDNLQKNFQESYKQLATGRGNLIRRAEELRSLGANSKKRLPGRLMDDAMAADDDALPAPTGKTDVAVADENG